MLCKIWKQNHSSLIFVLLAADTNVQLAALWFCPHDTFPDFLLFSDVKQNMKWLHNLLKSVFAAMFLLLNFSFKRLIKNVLALLNHDDFWNGNYSMRAQYRFMLLFFTHERAHKHKDIVKVTDRQPYTLRLLPECLAKYKLSISCCARHHLCIQNQVWSRSLSPVILYFVIIQGLDVWCKQFLDVGNHKWRVDCGLWIRVSPVLLIA